MVQQEVLRYEHADYTVRLLTDSIDSSWKRFRGRINYRNNWPNLDELKGDAKRDESDIYRYCRYGASAGCRLYLYRFEGDNGIPFAATDGEILPDAEEQSIGEELWPVVFETNQYQISITLRDVDYESVKISHVLKEVEGMFFYDWESNHQNCRANGRVDFTNEPGLFRLGIEYSKDGHRHEDYISFYVASPKLDVRHDYMSLLQEVSREFEGNIFRYLSLTVQQLTQSRQRSTSLELWMQAFQSVVNDYLKNVDRIIKNPHSKVRTLEQHAKADRIKRWTPAMEETYWEKKHEGKLEEHYFRYEVYDNTVNSMENRFVKYTLLSIGKKLEQVLTTVLGQSNTLISDSYRTEWKRYLSSIQRLQKHPFFQSVGKFEGMRHESLVLQSRAGYQQIYKDWLKLKKGIDFYEGTTNVGTLQIWEIYELWCFIKVKKMVTRILYPDGMSAETRKLKVKEPRGSLINYSKADGKSYYEYKLYYPDGSGREDDYVTVHYQHTYNRKSGEYYTLTTDNRPDIVLNIFSTQSQLELTYLFDAKYRVWNDPKLDKDIDPEDIEEWEALNTMPDFQGADYPPSDAINQMHRYRDAIYYDMDNDKRPESKEIIGGYILYPGRGDEQSFANRYFTRSIEKVNIGAFPLLPCGLPDEELKNVTDQDIEGPQLFGHLRKLLLGYPVAHKHVESAVPQRGLQYRTAIGRDEDLVLVNNAKKEKRELMVKNKICYTPAALESGSLHLIPGFETAKYVLLHDGRSGSLYELDGKGPRFAPKESLKTLGFEEAELSHEYYLIFSLKGKAPMQEDVSISRITGRHTDAPHFVHYKDLMIP